jgi:hypothetical protein
MEQIPHALEIEIFDAKHKIQLLGASLTQPKKNFGLIFQRKKRGVTKKNGARSMPR